jgi:hypothetical protein
LRFLQIAIANFRNLSAIAIGFEKKIAIAAQSIISARNFSQFAICDFMLTATCAQITNCEQS